MVVRGLRLQGWWLRSRVVRPKSGEAAYHHFAAQNDLDKGKRLGQKGGPTDAGMAGPDHWRKGV